MKNVTSLEEKSIGSNYEWHPASAMDWKEQGLMLRIRSPEEQKVHKSVAEWKCASCNVPLNAHGGGLDEHLKSERHLKNTILLRLAR
jgi:hypothetical protein